MPFDRPDQRDRITEAAAVIADWPALWQDLLKLHVAGADGRCRGCFSAVHPAPRVPCNIAELAAAAATLARARALPALDARKATFTSSGDMNVAFLALDRRATRPPGPQSTGR